MVLLRMKFTNLLHLSQLELIDQNVGFAFIVVETHWTLERQHNNNNKCKQLKLKSSYRNTLKGGITQGLKENIFPLFAAIIEMC